MNEIKYAPVKGFEDRYLACSEGYLINLKSRGIVRGSPHSSGYKQVCLCKGGVYHKLLHLVILEAFKPKPSPMHEANHKDLKRSNARLDNLEWLTHQENIDHARAAGVIKGPIGAHEGAGNNNSKLSQRQLDTLVIAREAGRSYAVLARQYGMSAPGIREAILTEQRIRK